MTDSFDPKESSLRYQTRGALYEIGEGVPMDFSKAHELYGNGCTARAADSCIRMARMYAQGRGVAKDPDHAAVLLGETCAMDKYACRQLGVMYENGLGVEQDAAFAI
jgi:uncharacterized protein